MVFRLQIEKISIILAVLTLALVGCTSSPTGAVIADFPYSQEKVTFVFDSVNFAFLLDSVENPEMVVKEGDVVQIILTSSDGYHDWVVDEFGATAKVRPGDNATVLEFTANQTGTFEYYCSVGSHREKGMFGKFIVE